MCRFHQHINQNRCQCYNQQTNAHTDQKPSYFFLADIMSGTADILFQKVFKIQNRLTTVVIKLLRHFVDNKICLQLLITRQYDNPSYPFFPSKVFT